jgi:3-oxoacyl-(acyl-carrier-protein) synthase
MGRRVFVTGLGAVTPIGINVAKSFKALCNGVTGCKALPKDAYYDFHCNVGAPMVEEAYSAEF